VAVVPARNDTDHIEIIWFDTHKLLPKFDKAWKALEKAGRSLNFDMPVFIPLDGASKKNVGHNVANLKALQTWSVCLSKEDVEKRVSSETRSPTPAQTAQAFFERVKREYAELNGVDFDQVEIEFRIKR
jgi:hypothetical protein